MKSNDDYRLYNILYKLAEEGKHRPSNNELGEMLGMSINRIEHSLTRLDRNKQIKRIAIGSRFYVKIIATGKVTGEKPKISQAYSHTKERNAEIAQERILERLELAERIDHDQAKSRAERERWLEIEKEKYGLPRKGRLVDDMIA